MSNSSARDSFLPPLWVLAATFVGLLIWLIVELRELVVLLVVGYFLAYAIDPLLEGLERRRIPRSWGFWLVSLVLVSIIALLGFTAIPTLLDEFGKLSDNLNHYIEIGKGKVGPLLEQFRGYLPDPIRESQSVDELVGRLPATLSAVSGDTLKGIVRAVGGTLMGGYNRMLTLINIALLPFIVYYLAVDLPRIHQFCLSIVPLTRRSKVAAVFGEIDGYVSAFVRGQVIVCSILFVLYAIGLGIVGVDLWLLLAVVAGFGNLVPYVGFVSGILLSSLMALVTFGDMQHVLWVWLVFAVVQALDGTFITPRVVGESVGLPPLVVILALFAGGQLFGLLGIFLAIPTAAVVRVLARHSYQWVVGR